MVCTRLFLDISAHLQYYTAQQVSPLARFESPQIFSGTTLKHMPVVGGSGESVSSITMSNQVQINSIQCNNKDLDCHPQ